jgi:hypothetical protein
MSPKRRTRCPNCDERYVRRVRRPVRCARCQHHLGPRRATVIAKRQGRQVFRGYAERFIRDHASHWWLGQPVARGDADRIRGLAVRAHIWLGERGEDDAILLKRIS